MGDQVKIWQDPWLPDMSNPWIESLPTVGLIEATVDSLKSTSGDTWGEDILASCSVAEIKFH